MAVQTHQPKPPIGISRLLFRLPIYLYRLGLEVDGSEAGYRQLGQQLPFVELLKRDP